MKKNETNAGHRRSVAAGDSSFLDDPVSPFGVVRGVADNHLNVRASQAQYHSGHGREIGEGVETRIEAHDGRGQRTVKNGKHR